MARKINKFILFVWMLVFFAALWLCCWPILMTEIARQTWTRMPCNVFYEQNVDIERYYFILNNMKYTQWRRDFWEMGNSWSPPSKNLSLPAGREAECYINPKNPNDSVLYLESVANLRRSGRRFGISVSLFLVAFLLSMLVKGKRH